MTTPSDEAYSPERRTALLLSGIGTAGAYHAGVLKALHEAGVKLDVVAGRGVGAVGALFAAVDGAQRLWDEGGFWRSPSVARLYSWRPLIRITALAVALALAVVLLPLTVMAAGLIVFPVDFVLKMIGVGGGGLVSSYVHFAEAMFAPAALPTWLPRLAVLVLGSAAAMLAVDAWLGSDRRRPRGAVWWRIMRPPVATGPVVEHVWEALWNLIRGAARLNQPPSLDLGRRYVELLAENLGQPGFRELLLTAHDVEAHTDLVFALVADPRRRELLRRPTTAEADARRASVVDISGVGRDHLADAIAGALTVPLISEYHTITFAPESYWRGETHRLCDRPASLLRLMEELAALGVEQVVLVSAAPDRPGPHQLHQPPLEGRARIGEYLQSAEAASVRDTARVSAAGGPRLFSIQPEHNPVGPFDFAGGFDDRSNRRLPLNELMNRGYEDAYRQFIEPVVGGSGERVGTRT